MRRCESARYDWPKFTEACGLRSCGPNLNETVRQAAVCAGQVLAGSKPTGLPIQHTTRFNLVINLRTVNALNLTIPPSIFGRAEEVIE
jgi:putative ABC transport system substrate-binding protein